MLTESRALRFVFFPVLYLAQGLPWGFVATGYGVLLADLGFDNATMGAMLGLAYLPWSFKILWGPLLDSVPALKIGRRRPFLIVAELLMSATLLGLWFLDPVTQMPLVTAALFLNNTFASLQDVATDALAIDVIPEKERGSLNGWMWAGKSLGVFLGGSGGLLVAHRLGWGALFVTLAALVAAVSLLPLLVRERPPSPEDQPVDGRLLRLTAFLLPFVAVGAAMFGLSRFEGVWVDIAQPFVAVGGALLAWPLVDQAGFRRLWVAFSTPRPWLGLTVGLVLPIGYAMIQASQTRLFRAELELSDDAMAFVTGFDPAFGVLGALFGGFLADRLGSKTTIGGTLSAVGLLLAAFGVAGAWWPSIAFLAGWTAAYAFFVNAFNAASLGLLMNLTDPRVGATQFAMFMATTNLTYAWAAPFGGAVADNFGYPALFAVAAGIQVTSLVVLVPLRQGRAS